MSDRNEPRDEAGQGGGARSDVLELVVDLDADPEALRDHVLRQAAEISYLRSQNERLESFRALALDAVESVANAGRRAGRAPARGPSRRSR